MPFLMKGIFFIPKRCWEHLLTPDRFSAITCGIAFAKQCGEIIKHYLYAKRKHQGTNGEYFPDY